MSLQLDEDNLELENNKYRLIIIRKFNFIKQFHSFFLHSSHVDLFKFFDKMQEISGGSPNSIFVEWKKNITTI